MSKRLRRECSVKDHEAQLATAKGEMGRGEFQAPLAEHSDGRPAERQEKKSVPVGQRTPGCGPIGLVPVGTREGTAESLQKTLPSVFRVSPRAPVSLVLTGVLSLDRPRCGGRLRVGRRGRLGSGAADGVSSRERRVVRSATTLLRDTGCANMASREPDLDNSLAVTVVTGVLYVAWLSVLAYAGLWFGLDPLVRIQQQFDGWVGTAAAVAAGVVFIAVSRNVFDYVRKRYFGSEQPAASPPPEAESPDPPPGEEAKPKRKRSKKKKKKKRKK